MRLDVEGKYKFRNGSYSVIVVISIMMVLIGYKAKEVHSNLILFVVGLMCFLLIVGVLRLRELIFTNKSVCYRSMISKKMLWSVPYTSIQQIQVDFWSDTKKGNKKLQIIVIPDVSRKANITNATMEELGKICHEKGVKLCYNSNNKYEEYRLPTFKKT